MNQPSFLKEIPSEFITLPIIKGKGDLCGIGKKWSLEQARQKLFDGYYISCCYYLKDTNYVVIDIDDPNYSLEQFYADTEIDSLYTVGNNKGYHVWLQMPKEKTDMFKKNLVKIGRPTADIDFLGEKVFEKVGKEWFGDEPCFLYPEQMSKCFKEGTFEPKKKNTEVGESSSIDLLRKLVELIAMEYCDNRDDWLKVIYAMKKCGFTEEEARNWSKKSERYTDSGFDSAWEQYSIDFITVGEGSIRYYAKKSNPTEYQKMTSNYFIPIDKLTKGALTVAECIAPKLEQHLKWSNDKWFMFYGKTNLWMETKEPSQIVVQMIHKHIDYSIQVKITERTKTEDTDQQKRITEQIQLYSIMYARVDVSGFYSMITKHLKTILYDSEFYYKLDNNPYKIAFLDGIYDMKTNTFRKGYNQDEFITKTIPFEYTEPTKEQTAFVRNVLFKICNCNQSHFEYYLSVLGQALLGDAELEKALYFCVGVGGNNGKTLIFEALADIMPNYVGKIERKTFEKGYSKAHKHLAGTKGKRVVYVEELSTKEQETEVLKEIGDGKNIKNEIMYGTDELINIMFKLFFLSNCQANLKVDGGIGNRYRQLCHNSKFNKDTTEDNYDTLDFIQDRTLAEKLKGDYKHALLKMFLDAGHQYTKTNKLTIPDEFEEAIANTLESNDEVKMWFNDNCEYGDEFKCSKKELENALAKPFREIQTEIQRITNLKYVRNMRFGKNSSQGGWKGFRIKQECLLKVDEE
jgi:hypothetical protein